MKQFLAFKSAPIYGASRANGAVVATEPNALADGAIGIFANDGVNDKLILVDAATDLADVKEFFIARGMPEGVPAILSDGIERENLKVTKRAAVTAIAKGMDITGIPTDLVAGTLVELVVVNTTPTISTDWKTSRYSYRTIAANESAATIIAALVAEADADGKSIVTVTDSSPTVNVDAINPKTNFDAYIEIGETRILRGTVSVEAVRAVGSVEQMQAVQLENEAYSGKTNYIDRTVGDVRDSNQVDTAAASYVTYKLGSIGTTVRLAVATDPVAMRFKRVTLAFPTGAAAIALVDTILGAASMEEVAGQAEETGA